MHLRLLWHRQTLSLHRIEIFSDSVFAIIITLLVLELKIPEVDTSGIPGHFSLTIYSLLPKILSYVISFITIAIFWVTHYQLFGHIKHSDQGLLWINNILLLFMAFIPFPTGLIANFPTEPLAVMMYGFVLFLVSLTFYFIRFYVEKLNLYHEKSVADPGHSVRKKNLKVPILYLIAMFVGGFWPLVGLLMFAGIPMLYLFMKNVEIVNSPRKLNNN